MGGGRKKKGKEHGLHSLGFQVKCKHIHVQRKRGESGEGRGGVYTLCEKEPFFYSYYYV